jgi:hypothetical protein
MLEHVLLTASTFAAGPEEPILVLAGDIDETTQSVGAYSDRTKVTRNEALTKRLPCFSFGCCVAEVLHFRSFMLQVTSPAHRGPLPLHPSW